MVSRKKFLEERVVHFQRMQAYNIPMDVCMLACEQNSVTAEKIALKILTTKDLHVPSGLATTSSNKGLP